MALYEVVLEQDLFQQQVINRWNYQSTDVPTGASPTYALAQALGFVPLGGTGELDADTMFGQMRLIQSQDIDNVNVSIRDVYDPTDFFSANFNGLVPGLSASPASAPFLTYGFSTNRMRTDIRRGQKRIAGVTEGAIDPGGAIVAGALTLLQNLADAMTAHAIYDNVGDIADFTPTIVSKKKEPLTGGGFTYKYWPTLTEQLAHSFSGFAWTPYSTIRSQVSRQYGRGA